jgi:DNA-binding response OmpR family regulator
MTGREPALTSEHGLDEEPMEQARSAAGRAGPGPRVLIVEDSTVIRILLAQLIANAGYLVIQAASGEEGLRASLDASPDVVVIDHQLPGLSGAELVRVVRGSSSARLRELPIVGISSRPESQRELVRMGADVAIRKPIGEAELLSAIEVARARRPGSIRDRWMGR